MLGLSAIFLSYTNSPQIHQMNLKCIDTLVNSEDFITNFNLEIIFIESNKNYRNNGYHLPQNVKVIVPESNFNFHRFLNIGIKNSQYEYLALCNNDLLFKPHWFSEIIEIANQNPKILSFSPADEGEHWKNNFELGYNIRTHIKGWCIVVKKELFNHIGMLDETFDFYYADDDYGLTLKHHKIPHALVKKSFVHHLGGANTETRKKEVNKDFALITHKYPNLPKYFYTEGYNWILKNEKLLDGHLKFHKKWGSPKWISFKAKWRKIWS